MPVEKFLSELVNPRELFARLRAACLADSIYHGESDCSYYDTVEMNDGSGYLFRVNDGSGNEIIAYVKGENAIVKGFDHESEVAAASLNVCDWLLDVPNQYSGILADPGFELRYTSFVIWFDKCEWRAMKRPKQLRDANDGSDYLIELLQPTHELYRELISNLLEEPVSIEDVRTIFRASDLTDGMLDNLRRGVEKKFVRGVATKLGYRIAGE